MSTRMTLTRIATIAAVVVLPLFGTSAPAAAQTGSTQKIGAEFWQWALSIPADVNPLIDPTGASCMVGQRGSSWYLAGFLFGGSAARACSIPAGTALVFPVLNSINFDTPNVCGQGSTRLTVAELRASSAALINDASTLTVMLDGKVVTEIERVRSRVFPLTLPENNVFDPFCADFGGFPGGVYPRAVDEGYYVKLDALSPGTHTLRIQATAPTFGVDLDVTYNLTVVPGDTN